MDETEMYEMEAYDMVPFIIQLLVAAAGKHFARLLLS